MKCFLFLFILSSFLFSQNCPPDLSGMQVIMDLTICHLKIDTTVEYKDSCNCYYYNYTITSLPENKGKIRSIDFEFYSEKSHPMIDQTLPSNPVCDYPSQANKNMDLNESENSIPISIVNCPPKWDSGPHWLIRTVGDENYL